jgi:hypothetical protein
LPSPLAGKLFDENSEPLYSQRTARGGRTYRYYVSRELIRSPAADVQAGWRVPAAEIERAVIGAARGILDDKQAVLAELQKSGIELSNISQIFGITAAWSERLLAEAQSASALVEVVERVELTEEGIRIVLKIPVPGESMDNQSNPRIFRMSRFVPIKMKRRGVEMRIIIESKEEVRRKVDPALLKAIARARRWFEELATCRMPSLTAIAKREHLAKRYVARLTKLAFIAPSIVEAVAEGRAPAGLNLQMLMDTRVTLPSLWKDQEPLIDLQI